MSISYPIFVISLDDAERRRQPLLDQLAEQGLQWQVFPGIDARNGVPAQYEALVDREKAHKRMRREMSHGEYGCALAHRAVYEKVVKDNLPGAVILEDDAILRPHFGDFLRSKDLESADMLVFDYLRLSVSRLRERRSVHDIKLHKIFAKSTRATGYSLSNSGAQKMLSATTPITYVADWPCDLFRIGAWATYPKLIDRPDDDPETSNLERERLPLYGQVTGKDPARYFQAEYWRKKIAKRVG